MRRAFCYIIALAIILSPISGNTLPSPSYSVVFEKDIPILEVGFSSNEITDFDDVPIPYADAVNLSIDSATSTASYGFENDSCYVYWRIQNSSQIKVELTASPLKSTDPADSLDYTVTLGDGREELSSKDNGATPLMLVESYAGNNDIEVGSKELKTISASLIGATGTSYEGTITVTVTGDSV